MLYFHYKTNAVTSEPALSFPCTAENHRRGPECYWEALLLLQCWIQVFLS